MPDKPYGAWHRHERVIPYYHLERIVGDLARPPRAGCTSGYSAQEAAAAFREKDYARVVELLAPVKAELSRTERARLEYCRKRL